MLTKKSDAPAKKSRTVLVEQLISVASGLVLIVGGFFFQQIVWPEGPPLAAYVLPGLILLGLAIVLSIWDDAERQRMQEALRESEEKLRRVFGAVADAIIVTDLDGYILDCNQAALVMYGHSGKEELIGKSSLRLIAEKDREKALAYMQNLLSSKEGLLKNTELLLVAKDGREFYGKIRASVAFDAFDRPKYIVMVDEDVTERELLEKDLQEYTEHLEQKVKERTQNLKDAQAKLVKSERLAAVGQVAAMVGHDLRNPLAGISGAAYYLKKRLNTGAEKRLLEMVELIEKNVWHSNRIIGDLLDYSKELRLDPSETTIHSIVQEALNLAEVSAAVKIVNLTDQETKIRVDLEKMTRVFVNIIRNAVEAMPKGGQLTITGKVSKNMCEIEFKDDGMGIDERTLQKLWSPFFTTKTKGMGLGLSICRRIVEAHGGRISVNSHVGKGTAFTISMPVSGRIKKKNQGIWVKAPEATIVDHA
jgi:PAS domain S-box-containing protein